MSKYQEACPSRELREASWKWAVKDEGQVGRHRGRVGPPGKGIKLQKGLEAAGSLSVAGGLRMLGQWGRGARPLPLWTESR